MDDRPVARDGDRKVFVRLPFDVNDLVDDLRIYPRAFHAILVWRSRIERLNIEVLHIGAVVGEAPRDVVVVANNDHGCARQSKPLDVPARSG